MAFTLDSLIQDLEQQALVKSAADESVKKEEKKDEKKPEDDKSKTEGKEPEAKKDESETESGKEEQEKKASADLAQQIMQKVASAQSTEETNEMQKQASIAGKALADALLTKLASAGDVSTTNGIPAGVAPNKSQVDNAQLVAEQDGTIKPMPTGDGIKNEGSINQIFDAIVQDAISQGGVNKTEVEAGQIAGKEGAVEAHATPNQVPNESVEKTAAVIELVNQGVDFDSAVDMVKSAAAELEFEEGEQIKQAAMNELMGNGIDFDTATEMVKSAGIGSAIGAGKAALSRLGARAGQAVGTAKGYAGQAGQYLRNQGVKASVGGENLAFGLKNRDLGIAGRGVRQLAGNPLVQGGAGLAALGAGGYALAHQKQAAVNSLIEAGVDFDSAVALVQDKSQELYGA